MRLGIAVSVLLAVAVVAQAAPITSINQSDWVVAQLGQDGSSSIGSNNLIDFSTPGTLQLGGKWNTGSSVALVKGGDSDNGKFLDLSASITFTAIGNSTFDANANTGTRFGMSLRQNSAIAPNNINTYPLYRVDYFKANNKLSIREQSGYSRYRTIVESNATTLLAGSAVYKLQFSVQNNAAGDAVLVASLLENGVTKISISGIDYAKGATQEGGSNTDWADSGADVYGAGHVGIFAAAPNNGTNHGINITAISIPEPATMSLLGLGLFGLLRRRVA